MSICHPLLWVLWLLYAAVPPSGDLQARVIHSFKEDTGGGILRFCFSADGRRLLQIGGRTLRLFDTTSGKELARFRESVPGRADYPYGAALFPDGRTAAVGYSHRDFLTVDLVTGKVLRQITHEHLGYWQALSPDGKLLVSGSAEGSSMGRRALLLWEVESGRLLRRLRLRDPATGQELDPSRQGPLVDYRDEYSGVVFAPDGKTVAVGVSDGSTRLCDVATGAETRCLFHKEDHNCWATRLAFSPDGRFLAVGGWHHRTVMARIWDVTTGQVTKALGLPIPPPPPGFLPIQARPGMYLNPKTRERIILRVPSGTWALAFSQDGRTVATTTEGKIYLWEVATAKLRCRLSFPAKHLDHLQFSLTGLLVAGGRGIGQVWDWRTPWSKPAGPLAATELERLWSELGLADAVVGHRAIITLAAVPDQAVELLGKQLLPVESVTLKELDRLIAELDDKKFVVRLRAEERLQALAEAAKPALLRELGGKPLPEKKQRIEKLLAQLEGALTPERLQFWRGVEVLEYVGTAQARRILEQLARGMAGAAKTEEARAALRRLKDRE